MPKNRPSDKKLIVRETEALEARGAAGRTKGSGGPEALDWEVPEFTRYERPWWWYVLAGSIGLALLVYAVVTLNFLFAVIIVMAAVVITLNSWREPRLLAVKFSPAGLELNSRLYRYKDMRSFWICYEPGTVTELYFEFQGWRPRLSLHLGEQDPNVVRAFLRRYVREDVAREEEPLSDFLGRTFKI